MNRARKQMVNEAQIGSVRNFPGYGSIAEKEPTKRPTWMYRAAVWSGVIMSNPESTKGWTFNPSTVTLSLLIAGMIAGGSYYMGSQAERERHILERLQKAEKDAETAARLAAAVSGSAGHEQQEQKKK